MKKLNSMSKVGLVLFFGNLLVWVPQLFGFLPSLVYIFMIGPILMIIGLALFFIGLFTGRERIEGKTTVVREKMPIDTPQSRRRYRKYKIAFKSIIIILLVLALVWQIEYGSYISVYIWKNYEVVGFYAERIYYRLYGPKKLDSAIVIINPLYWVFIVLFFIGIILNFLYIKPTHRFSKYQGYFTGTFTFLGFLGMVLIPIFFSDYRLSPIYYPYPGEAIIRQYTFRIESVSFFIIVIILIMFIEGLLLNIIFETENVAVEEVEDISV